MPAEFKILCSSFSKNMQIFTIRGAAGWSQNYLNFPIIISDEVGGGVRRLEPLLGRPVLLSVAVLGDEAGRVVEQRLVAGRGVLLAVALLPVSVAPEYAGPPPGPPGLVLILNIRHSGREVAGALARLPPAVVEHEGGQQQEDGGEADQEDQQPGRALHLRQVGLHRDGEAGGGQRQVDRSGELPGPGLADRTHLDLEVLRQVVRVELQENLRDSLVHCGAQTGFVVLQHDLQP